MDVISVSKAHPHVSNRKDASHFAPYSVYGKHEFGLVNWNGRNGAFRNSESIESVALQSLNDSLFRAVRVTARVYLLLNSCTCFHGSEC